MACRAVLYRMSHVSCPKPALVVWDALRGPKHSCKELIGTLIGAFDACLMPLLKCEGLPYCSIMFQCKPRGVGCRYKLKSQSY